MVPGVTPRYRRVNLADWPRREHYLYYTEQLKVDYNVTVPVRVDALLRLCRTRGLRFYPAFLSVVTGVVNGMECLRMFRGAEGALCLWEHVVPNYTIFHEDDHTFSDCWSEYAADFGAQYRLIASDMARYADCRGIKARAGQPPNFFCVSCAPWLHFTGYSSRVAGREPQFFPIITAGKYIEAHGETRLPVSLTVAHAVCDGWHAGQFFERLQAAIDELEPNCGAAPTKKMR